MRAKLPKAICHHQSMATASALKYAIGHPIYFRIRAATFWPAPELRMLGQPNRGYRDRWVSMVSFHRPCGGALRSLRSQPIASDFIGSAFTCASWIRPHLVHRTVQCSNPERAEVICWISMRDWHLGQRGRAAAGSDKAGVCGSGIDASR